MPFPNVLTKAAKAGMLFREPDIEPTPEESGGGGAAVIERRIDPSNGKAYTRQSFLEVYGGTDEWEEANPRRRPSRWGRPTHDSGGGAGASASVSNAMSADPERRKQSKHLASRNTLQASQT
jgi:hypothetical protein